MRLIVLGVVALAMGVGLLLWGHDRTRAARASAAWPVTDGVVASARVVRHGGGSGSRSARVTWEADVGYRYAVAGRSHESATFVIGVAHEYADSAAAAAEVAAYPRGRRVRVAYDPSDPAQSTLAPGLVSRGLEIAVTSLWALPVLGAGLIAGGWWSVRRRGGVRTVVAAAFFGGPGGGGH